MSVQHTLRCVFAHLGTPARHCLRRSFHTSKRLSTRPSPKHRSSLKPENMGLTTPTKQGVRTPEEHEKELSHEELGPPDIDAARLADPRTLHTYTDSEKARLAELYTPEQVESIEAGEAAINPKDLKNQAMLRTDKMGLKYFDDLSSIHPVVDKPIRAPEENYDPNLRFKTEDEIIKDYTDLLENMPEEEKEAKTAWHDFHKNRRLMVGKEEAERNPRNFLAPELPVMAELKKGYKNEDIEPTVQRLMRQTGYSNQEIRRFRTKVLVTHRVVNQTRMGKQQRQYYLCVAGNGKGLLGIGEGKSSEPEDARRMATQAAIRNMQPIPRYEERTIFGDVKGKVAGTEVELMTRTPGFGIRCQAYIYEMCKCAGISDMAARVYRSRNPMNTVKATLQALLSQQNPEEVARARGRKLVDVRKVYYAGNV